MKKLASTATLAVLVLLNLLIVGDTRIEVDRFEEVAMPYSYNILLWEAKNLPSLWQKGIVSTFRTTFSPALSDVKEYFRLGQEIEALKQTPPGDDGSQEGPTQSRLLALEKQRASLEAAVEDTLAKQIAEVFLGEGLGFTIPFLRTSFLFPPVAFQFDNTPYVFVVSPRERIDLLETRLLKTDLTVADMDVIEAQVETIGFSAIVEGTGGVATYPSIVPPRLSLRNAIANAAHEWVHQYLFFHPLGRNYWTNNEMTTINETIADMVGNEVADSIYPRYSLMAGPSPSTSGNAKADSGFDFNVEMHNIRLTVDELLFQGKVQEAESFMEERRKALAAKGYYVRKLNQAYFAFHGTYADTPASTSPINEELAVLRKKSKSLGDFLSKAANFSSHEDLKQALNDQP
ncbi:MAG: hypothetical protein HYX82_04735 [Chloroflexi bacterium]|nr:hypothetical protein [Chloroflexota bacterium]